jgi:putative transposase
MDADTIDTSKTTYPTDVSDEQWRLIRPLIPPSRPIGADRSTSIRAVVNAILYRERSGCSWRMLPHDFPHWRTVYGYYCQWKAAGVWGQMCGARRQCAGHGTHSEDVAMAE